MAWQNKPQSSAVRTKPEIISALLQARLIAVVRARSMEQVLPLAQALLRGGICAIEITMTTPSAIEAIHRCVQTLPPSALIGVGTVLTPEVARKAIAAGA